MQNSQYPPGYGGQQTYNPNYPTYNAGSTSATTGVDPYTGLATTQTTVAQTTPSMAPGYPGGQSMYYGNGVPSSAPPTYGSTQPSPSLYSSQSTPSNYPYGAGYPGSVRSPTGGLESYAPYPTTNSTPNVHQSSPYGSTYPSGQNPVSLQTTALGAVAGMPVPLGSGGAGATGAEGEQEGCLVM